MARAPFAKMANRLIPDTNGMAAIEFAMILPPFLMLLMGAFDMGHELYVRSALQGEVQKAARDSGLQTGSGSAQQVSIDTRVRNTAFRLVRAPGGRSLVITRRAFTNFGDIGRMEDFTDSDGDNICDLGEPFEDLNGNATWDEKGVDGQGGARAAVLFKATLTYPRMFPTYKLMGFSRNVKIVAETVLRNQPYNATLYNQVPVAGNCAPGDI
jgi:TadE-like protein